MFLDTNFWIMARQAATGETDKAELISLLDVLCLGVQSGKLFFPITSDRIAEFSKQPLERLADTMTMVDRLSLGVASRLPSFFSGQAAADRFWYGPGLT